MRGPRDVNAEFSFGSGGASLVSAGAGGVAGAGFAATAGAL